MPVSNTISSVIAISTDPATTSPARSIAETARRTTGARRAAPDGHSRRASESVVMAVSFRSAKLVLELTHRGLPGPDYFGLVGRPAAVDRRGRPVPRIPLGAGLATR